MPRKKPFSSKQKKKQLQERRQRRHVGEASCKHDSPASSASDGETEVDILMKNEAVKDRKNDRQSQVTGLNLGSEEIGHNFLKINSQPRAKPQERYDPNKYRLHFFKESEDDMAKRKEQARHPYTSLTEECLEMDIDVGVDNFIDIPKRPPWDYKLSKKQVEDNEERYFKEYLENLFSEKNSEDLSYMELNLETWRQLWRVLEISDVFLMITDIRHPAMHFPPALYSYITVELKKSIIIVLNKVDLAPPSLVVAWQHYFRQRFPLVSIVCFSSFPKSKEEMDNLSDKFGKVVFKKRKRGTYRALGPKELLTVCKDLAPSNVDLSNWEYKIEVDQGCDTGENSSEEDDENDEKEVYDDDQDNHQKEVKPDPKVKTNEGDENDKHGILTIGCIGYPNVGKSSVINGLMGKKVVSVSRTPGHTKHFQTIFLTPTVKLCDCPGLVFPSTADRNLQILGGIYPISQVREPYSAIGYLAVRMDLPKLLRIKPLDDPMEGKTYKWSVMDICEAWAEKRGFLTARAARLDTYRSANNLLRMALDGRICLCLYPKGYVKNKDEDVLTTSVIQCEPHSMSSMSPSGLQLNKPVIAVLISVIVVGIVWFKMSGRRPVDVADLTQQSSNQQLRGTDLESVEVTHSTQLKVKVGDQEITVAYRETSNNPKLDVLFLHGAAFKSLTWVSKPVWTLQLLYKTGGFRAVAIDIPGYGDTKEAKVDPALFMEAVISTLQLHRPVIVSPSMSGGYALPYLFKDPANVLTRARGFVAVAPVDTGRYSVDDYKGLKIPTLVIVGDQDTGIGEVAKKNLEALPDHETEVLKEAGHACYMNKPDEFNKRLLEFLNKLMK